MTERLLVAKYVQKNQAVLSDDAEKIYRVLHEFLEKNRAVVLDFSGISLLISSFMNSAIGKLYGEFESDHIERFVAYENMDGGDEYILRKVIGRAIDYNKHKDVIDRIIDDT